MPQKINGQDGPEREGQDGQEREGQDGQDGVGLDQLVLKLDELVLKGAPRGYPIKPIKVNLTKT